MGGAAQNQEGSEPSSPGSSNTETRKFEAQYGVADDDALLQQGKKYAVRFPQAEDGPEDLTRDIVGFLRRQAAQTTSNLRNKGWFEWLGVFFPCVFWLRKYSLRDQLLADVAAGLSVGAMVIPQGMSYAKLAGLPSVFGLYGSCIPVFIYVLLGSSRQLAVGPVAVTSLILGSGLPDVIDAPVQTDPNNPRNPRAQLEYNRAAIQVALLAGIMYTCVGLLRLGWVTNFLSHSVIAGFITGASTIIGLSQVKYIFGYNTRPNPANTGTLVVSKTITFPRHDPVQEQLHDLLGPTWTPYFRWEEFVMGATWIAVLLLMKNAGSYHKRLGFMRAIGPLTVTVISIALMNIFKWYNPVSAPVIRPVGVIPKGMPDQTVSIWFPMPNFGKKLLLAVVVCLVDVLESISIAKALAYRNKYELNPTQELRAIGFANLAGAAFSCYTTTGSFSRSAVANDTGAKSQIFGLTSAFVVMITLLVLTPVFKYMPQNAQGAIVISAVVGLFNWKEGVFLWKVNKFDFIVFMVAAICVMLLGVEKGLACAIGLSIAIVIYKSAFPHTAVLGRLPHTQIYRNTKQYPQARVLDNILCLRIDAPIYFANVMPLKDRLEKYEKRAEEYAASRGTRLRFVIIDLSPVSDIDASAVHWLKDWIVNHKERGIQPVFANPARQVVRLMENARLPKLIGEEFICVRIHDAVLYCQELLAEEAGIKSQANGGAPTVVLDQPIHTV